MKNDNIDYEALAKRLRTRVPNATRCWEAWLESRVSNFAVESKGMTAFRNRMTTFQNSTGLPNGEVVRLCKILAIFEQEIYPGVTTDGMPLEDVKPDPAKSAPPRKRAPKSAANQPAKLDGPAREPNSEE